ncbi:hypothetical protein QQS21_009648 [Conoideocrella luteorostrata]|uniref:SMP-LTD domain-containing protein n=1 Tax=Conoideocrella luteorostrata TaxID=1105319 RepID=A0AAJ0FUW1_9HYPO|nr:hypothetical protein QQS21_009648 [Conoideocrella luteorostrata]
MGPWMTLFVAYLLGGVTFIPLVILAVLAHAHYTLPYRHDLIPGGRDEHGIVQPGDDTSALNEAKNKTNTDETKARPARDLDVAAGYFAVCREYTPMGLNAKPIERPTPVGSATVAAPSPSVYQTMYRSIFDRKPVAGPLDGHGNTNGMSQRPKKAGNVFYVVLRHGHLMLFDDDEQLEVRHVISLAHHNISIYSGGDVTPEGELFIKRNALCLSRKQSGADKPAPDSHTSKPFYLFSENCSAKEDFYFALLKNQEQTFGFDSDPPPIPKGFEVKNIISLVQRLHSSEDHVHIRWLNAMIGRVFLAVYRTRDLENFLREKITKKIARVKRPSFLANITIQKIDTGEAAPYFTNLKLKDLTVEGECVVEADVRYTGNFRIEVGATAKIDLGTRFKAREVTLLLAVVLKRIEGHVLFKIKAPPSNRMWMSFQTMPKMEMAIEPIVSSRQITYTLILRQIENRIKEVFAETLVQPFWDDVPFFKTEQKLWRGGIFQDHDPVETSDPAEPLPTDIEVVEPLEKTDENQDMLNQTRPIEKSHTLPVVDQQPATTGFFGRKLGKNVNGSATSVLSAGINPKPASPASPASSTSRSLNMVKNSTGPVVGTEAAHADLFKPLSSPPDHATNLMASLASRSHQEASSPTNSPFGSPAKPHSLAKLSRHSSTSSKEVEDKEERGEAEATPIPSGRRNTASSAESLARSEDSGPASPAHSATGSFKSQAGSLGRNFFARRETGSTTMSSESSASGELKKTTLAAVTNVAEQARQWGWNAIRRQKEHRGNGEKPHQIDLSQPMGRGQPLPPPGTPLPGPTNGPSRLGSAAASKRKPVPASAAPIPEQTSTAVVDSDKEPPLGSSQPPPLPQRRRRGASQQQEEEVEHNMLVVAAPNDSQPGTPAAEKASYDEAWGNAAKVEPAKVPDPPQPSLQLEPESTTGTLQGPVPKPPLPTASGSLLSSEHAPPVDPFVPDTMGTKESPLVAIPATVADIDDEDEDFSGWMENDNLDDDHAAEPLPVVTTAAMKQG